ILLPVVSAVRTKGHVADTQAMLARIAAGIEAYYGDHKAYPDPLHNGQIYDGGVAVDIDGLGSDAYKQKITQPENLVLGLLGGLTYVEGKAPKFDKNAIGNGPVGLNPRNPKKYRAYMDKVSLSECKFKDESGEADDTDIPEFVDR